MGGKRKTKWRKLPIEEFTKEVPTTRTQNVVKKQNSNTDIARNEESQPTYTYSPDDFTSTYQAYNEHAENPEGMVLSTPYLVYNPVEMPIYTNYIMPPDHCCYLPPDMAPAQDYVTVPYQEYVPPFKDTVYLLLPAPALRPPHGYPYLSYDLRNRRRRRRYEGYAEYAVIPEKTNYGSNKVDKTLGKEQSSNDVSSERNDIQSKHTTTMTSVSENNCFSKENQEQGQKSFGKIPFPSSQMRSDGVNKNFSNFDNNECVQKQQHSLPNEFCGVHTGKKPKRSDPRKDQFRVPLRNTTKDGLKEVNVQKEKDYYSRLERPEGENNVSKNLGLTKPTERKLVNSGRDVLSNENNFQNNLNKVIGTTAEPLPGSTKQSLDNRNITDSVSKEDKLYQTTLDQTERNEKFENNSSSRFQLPYLNSTDKPINIKSNLDQNETIRKTSPEPSVFEKPNETQYVNKSNLSQCSQDNDIELKNFPTLPSLKTNQSIYKLAFDESITDHSEESSRSPSPIDPESQVPRSLINDEILIHEADSGSEAGSEDIELIPHRYESETFLNENKHMYVNKLSLAVELLRTHENLPYDDQFKRVVGENDKNPKNASAGINFGFVDDLTSEVKRENTTNNLSDSPVVTSQSDTCKLAINTDTINSISSEDKFNESCEEAKEDLVERNNNQDISGEVRTGYRRFGVNLRHYFTPRALVNPCLCCIVM